LALSVTLVFALWLSLHLGGDNAVTYFDDIITALAALTGCVACLLASRRQTGPERRFWLFLGLALGAWTFAEVVWGVYDLVLHVSVPVPSWADVGYLGAIPLAAAALLFHPAMRSTTTRKARAALDGVAIGTALVLLSWTFVLGPLWRHTDLSTAGGVVALAYPFGDMVILFLVILSVRAVTASSRKPLLWVLLGLFAMAVSDSTYAYLVEVGRYSTGNIVDTGWVFGYLAIAVGASWDTGEAVVAAPVEMAEESLVSLVTPYIPVLLALGVITVKLELHNGVDRLSWLAGLGLALLVIARQLLQLHDRRRELFAHEPYTPEAVPEVPAGTAPATLPATTAHFEAAPWPQFVRRLP
jgi:hypothetical protein